MSAKLLIFLAAIFFGEATSPAQNIYSHCLSWWIIFICAKAYLLFQPKGYSSLSEEKASDHLLLRINELSFAIANTVLCQTLSDMKWLTPLIFCGTHFLLLHIQPSFLDEGSRELDGGARRPSSILLAYIAIAAASCLLLLPRSIILREGLLALWALVFQVAVFVLSRNDGNNEEQQRPDFWAAALERISLRVLVVLTFFAFAIPYTSPADFEVSTMGSLLAIATASSVFWVALLILNYASSYEIAPLSYTYCALMARAFYEYDFWRAAAPASAALIALSQLAIYCQRSPLTWKFIALLAFLPLIPVLTTLYVPAPRQGEVDWNSRGLNAAEISGPLHPIEILAAAGEERWNRIVGRQSKTLEQAIAEYRARYRRYPPPGFDKWFWLCREKDVVLVDEFDEMTRAMEPLWGVPPQELRRRTKVALEAQSLYRFSIENGEVRISGLPDWWSEKLIEMVSVGLPFLPDMEAAFNGFDEPRVVVPHDMLEFVSKRPTIAEILDTLNDTSDYGARFIDFGHQKTWDYATMSCAVNSPARSPQWHQSSNSTLSFIANATIASDLCLNPDLAHQHGFFVSPASFWLTNNLVPIFSQGRPNTFQDILYPPSYYLNTANSSSELDIPYANKSNQLYWAGSTTGGIMTASNWRNMHRSRFVALANSKDTPVLLLDNEGSVDGKWTLQEKNTSSLHDLFDVKFTAVVQCPGDDCSKELTSHLTFSDPEDASKSYGSKLVIDLDGNGFSGRYYRLLRSNSAVLKQTVFREWHDDWLVPWVHYIPVSTDFGELGEIVRFLSRDERGHEVGQRIAKAGTQFAKTSLRREDLSLVLARVLMEYGRLVNDDRDSLRCC